MDPREISAKLVDPSSAEWVAALSHIPHDFYHLPCYAELSATAKERPRAFVATDGANWFLAPLLEREIPSELSGGRRECDASTPYGYSGPVWSRDSPPSFVEEALKRLRETLREEGIIAAFFRLHALLNSRDSFSLFGETVSHGPTVYIDLRLSDEELWRQTRRGHRREIIALRNKGYEVSIDQNWAGLDDFLRCYNQTMDRVRADASYYFRKEYFLALRECLGERANLCIVRLRGEVACAGIATEIDGLAQYHLSATVDAHLAEHPSKLMLDFLRGWLKSRGNHTFHIGGGVGALEDKLHLFKIGFSPLTTEFNTWRVITDPERYNALVDRWRGNGGSERGRDERFFPQYRAPIER